MTESRQEKLMWLRAQMKLTSQCWALKELAKDIWNRPWSEERRSDWQRWLALAANSDVPMMKNAAKTIGKRLYGILNAMRHSVSNGNAEALNSKIRLLRIKAGDTETGSALNWGDVPLRKAEYGVLSLPTMIGKTHIYTVCAGRPVKIKGESPRPLKDQQSTGSPSHALYTVSMGRSVDRGVDRPAIEPRNVY